MLIILFDSKGKRKQESKMTEYSTKTDKVVTKWELQVIDERQIIKNKNHNNQGRNVGNKSWKELK